VRVRVVAIVRMEYRAFVAKRHQARRLELLSLFLSLLTASALDQLFQEIRELYYPQSTPTALAVVAICFLVLLLITVLVVRRLYPTKDEAMLTQIEFEGLHRRQDMRQNLSVMYANEDT
jgi:hypothetical protein